MSEPIIPITAVPIPNPTTTAQCPSCAATIQLTKKPYTYAWDGGKWIPSLWTPWAGKCPNQCGFVSGQALMSYGLRPRQIGEITP